MPARRIQCFIFCSLTQLLFQLPNYYQQKCITSTAKHYSTSVGQGWRNTKCRHIANAPTLVEIKTFTMRTTILIFVILLLASCEGIIKLSGRVIAEKNETPIEGAKIELLDILPMIHFDSLRNAYDSSFFLIKMEISPLAQEWWEWYLALRNIELESLKADIKLWKLR